MTLSELQLIQGKLLNHYMLHRMHGGTESALEMAETRTAIDIVEREIKLKIMDPRKDK